MALDLSSVFAKIARSKENFDEVGIRAAARLKSGDFKVSMELNPDATEHVWRFHAPKGTDFKDVSVCVGDCIHNLRSALDHLVYAIAVHESAKNPPPDENILAFPITTKPGDFKRAKNRIRTLSIGAQKAIEKVQPYNRVQNGSPSALSLLGRLDDVDKHRLLQVVALVPRFRDTILGWENVEGENHKVTIRDWPETGLKDGSVICTMNFNSPQPQMKGTFKGTFFLAIRYEVEPSLSGIMEVSKLLNAVGAEAEYAIKSVATAVV
jgi:hypothetical protein